MAPLSLRTEDTPDVAQDSYRSEEPPTFAGSSNTDVHHDQGRALDASSAAIEAKPTRPTNTQNGHNIDLTQLSDLVVEHVAKALPDFGVIQDTLNRQAAQNRREFDALGERLHETITQATALLTSNIGQEIQHATAEPEKSQTDDEVLATGTTPANSEAATVPEVIYESWIAKGVILAGETFNYGDSNVGIAGVVTAAKLTCGNLTLCDTGVLSGDVSAEGCVHLYGQAKNATVRAHTVILHEHCVFDGGSIISEVIGIEPGAQLVNVGNITTKAMNNNRPAERANAPGTQLPSLP